jgi:nicotinamide-nucleotide amidase
MKVEVVAIGTELLLGQINDTNSSWIGEQLAMAGIDTHFQTKVGDNQVRIVETLRLALSRSDAVICCGGLGPTHDDLTRHAIAEVMGTQLLRDEAIVARITEIFASRGRYMAANNLQQADVPVGAWTIPQQPGTAPGLVCPVGDKVIYAVPGVPYEMKEMVLGTILGDLQDRAGVRAAIVSRTFRTWGQSESGLAEMLAGVIEELDGRAERGEPTATIAFLASGIEGIKVRVTAKAPTQDEANAMLDAEERVLRDLLGELIFGLDDETMESVVLDLCREAGLTLATAESVTGGLIASRISALPGASDVFRGGVVAYDPAVKHEVLGVPAGPVVTEDAAAAMARGARRVLGAGAAVATSGVAGPSELEHVPVGTVCLAVAIGDDVVTQTVRLPGDRARVSQFAAISAADLLRRTLLARR